MTLRRFLLTLLVVGVLGGIAVVLVDSVLLPALVHRRSEVLVPELVGVSLDEARQRARHVGLTVDVGEEVFRTGVTPGEVLEQYPPPFTSVRGGRPVRLVVSKGDARALVPDLTGMTLRQSELTLRRLGLVAGSVCRTYDPTGPAGVVAQRPYPGTELVQGEAVRLLVREGREPVHHRMPNVVGQSLVVVRETIARGGFEVGRVTYREDDRETPGVVLDQWPPAGSRIPLGGTIDLVASSRGR